jgi:putative glutamine amidotransferase
MTRNPVIGITLSPFHTNTTSQENPPSWPAYARAVASGGGSPVFIPTLLEPNRTEALLDRLDALVLSGGGDIHPERYGEEISTDLDEPDPERDAFEFASLNFALERQMPFLGICRGIQVMNVVLGGTLIQDIPSEYPQNLPHVQLEEDRNPHHVVKLHSGTMLGEVFGGTEIEVNSFHHQAIRAVATGLRVSGRSRDGIIEAVELEGFPFGVGVQWHPERMLQQESSQSLFRALVKAALGEYP